MLKEEICWSYFMEKNKQAVWDKERRIITSDVSTYIGEWVASKSDRHMRQWLHSVRDANVWTRKLSRGVWAANASHLTVMASGWPCPHSIRSKAALRTVIALSQPLQVVQRSYLITGFTESQPFKVIWEDWICCQYSLTGLKSVKQWNQRSYLPSMLEIAQCQEANMDLLEMATVPLQCH
jgi:hypothetical protein